MLITVSVWGRFAIFRWYPILSFSDLSRLNVLWAVDFLVIYLSWACFLSVMIMESLDENYFIVNMCRERSSVQPFYWHFTYISLVCRCIESVQMPSYNLPTALIGHGHLSKANIPLRWFLWSTRKLESISGRREAIGSSGSLVHWLIRIISRCASSTRRNRGAAGAIDGVNRDVILPLTGQ